MKQSTKPTDYAILFWIIPIALLAIAAYFI